MATKVSEETARPFVEALQEGVMSQPTSPTGGGAGQGEEMLLRLLQGQQEQLARLQEMIGAQMQGQQQLPAATQSVAAASSSRTRGLIDVKAVGRPNALAWRIS